MKLLYKQEGMMSYSVEREKYDVLQIPMHGRSVSYDILFLITQSVKINFLFT
jgi:hypothetical protein